MAYYSTIILISNDESSRYLHEALMSIGLQSLGQVNPSDDIYKLSYDDINTLIFVLVGSGGLVSALSAYFKYRSKRVKVKIDKNGFIEIECSNISKEEIKSIISDIKELNLNSDS